MEYLIKGGQLLLSLSLLIVLHEFGHYLPARKFKTRVEKFYLFFDYKFSIFKKKIGDTEWGIGWIPLGGYVKISGMIDESMDKEQMDKAPQEWEFRAKPAWQRLIIMVGGVTVNLIVGILIYMMITFVWGKDYTTNENLANGYEVNTFFEAFGFKDGDKVLTLNGEKPFSASTINIDIALHGATDIEVLHEDGTIETITVPEDTDMEMFKAGAMRGFSVRYLPLIDSVNQNCTGQIAGLQKGDYITSINNTPITYWHEFDKAVKDSNYVMKVEVKRNGELVMIDLPLGENYISGISIDRPHEHKDYGFGESLGQGFSLGIQTLGDYVGQMKYLFTSKGAGSVGGFGAIGGMFSPTWDWHSFWLNTAFLSIVLAFMNVLPIPALDGGHIMFLMYEIVSGRKPNDKFMEYAQAAGMILLLGLLLYANGNDVYKAIFGG